MFLKQRLSNTRLYYFTKIYNNFKLYSLLNLTECPFSIFTRIRKTGSLCRNLRHKQFLITENVPFYPSFSKSQMHAAHCAQHTNNTAGILSKFLGFRLQRKFSNSIFFVQITSLPIACLPFYIFLLNVGSS